MSLLTLNQYNHDLLVIKRWLPNHFEDILWSHIEHRTRNMQGITEPEPVHYNATLFQVGDTLSKPSPCEDPCESGAIRYTPRRRCANKAKRGKGVHACKLPGCDKVCDSMPILLYVPC